MAEKNMAQVQDAPPMSEALRTELEQLTNIQRAAVLMLLLGEQEAANIIQYLDPKEVQPLGPPWCLWRTSRKRRLIPCWTNF